MLRLTSITGLAILFSLTACELVTDFSHSSTASGGNAGDSGDAGENAGGAAGHSASTAKGGKSSKGGTTGKGGSSATGGTSSTKVESAAAGGSTSVGGVSSTGGTNASGGVSGVATAGATTTGGTAEIAGTSVVCSASQTRSCALSGALGTCANGTQPCVDGKWGACSILPASTDNCVVGNDDNCNGKTNDTACKVVQIAAGYAHTCALLSDGMVRCWGANANGELGNGKTAFSAKPELVSALSDIKSIDVGYSVTCAITVAGAVKCWGSNGYGQLGPAVTADKSTTAVDIALPNGVKAAAIAVGDSHICVIVESDRSVLCWGRSDSGQLGTNNPSAGIVKVPVAVMGLSGVLTVRAGNALTCAAFSNGPAECWGNGAYGKNGNDPGVTPVPDAPLPRLIVGGGHFTIDAIDVATGPAGEHACALNNTGNAFCWGYNYFGQVGAASSGSDTGSSVSPVLTASGSNGFSGIVAMSAGANHTCGALTDGTAVCWGDNSSGQLGNGTTSIATTPYAVSLLTTVEAIDAGAGHTCALLKDKTAWCWGGNSLGQVGDSTTTQRNQPVKVLGLLP